MSIQGLIDECQREFSRFNTQPYGCFAHEIQSNPKLLYSNEMFCDFLNDSNCSINGIQLNELIAGREEIWKGLETEVKNGFSNFSPANEGRPILFVRKDGSNRKLVIECREIVETALGKVVFCRVVKSGAIARLDECLSKLNVVGGYLHKSIRFIVRHPQISAVLSAMLIGFLEEKHAREILIEFLKGLFQL